MTITEHSATYRDCCGEEVRGSITLENVPHAGPMLVVRVYDYESTLHPADMKKARRALRGAAASRGLKLVSETYTEHAPKGT